MQVPLKWVSRWQHSKRLLWCDDISAHPVYRPYAIDVITSCNQTWNGWWMEMQILHRHFEWQNNHGLWSLSTAELFASSFLTSAGSDLTFAPRMHKVSLDLTLTKACLIDAVHELTNCFTVLKLYGPQSSLPLKMAAWYLGFRPLSILCLITWGTG